MRFISRFTILCAGSFLLLVLLTSCSDQQGRTPNAGDADIGSAKWSNTQSAVSGFQDADDYPEVTEEMILGDLRHRNPDLVRREYLAGETYQSRLRSHAYREMEALMPELNRRINEINELRAMLSNASIDNRQQIIAQTVGKYLDLLWTLFQRPVYSQGPLQQLDPDLAVEGWSFPVSPVPDSMLIYLEHGVNIKVTDEEMEITTLADNEWRRDAFSGNGAYLVLADHTTDRRIVPVEDELLGEAKYLLVVRYPIVLVCDLKYGLSRTYPLPGASVPDGLSD